jgi:hypothetical protein
MKVFIRLEAIGDNLRILRSAVDNGIKYGNLAPLLFASRLRGRMKMESICPRRAWIACITGRDEKYKYAREFIKPIKDYSEASGTGARGVYYNYFLDDGIYEVNELVSWKNQRRYFVRVKDGRYIVINKDEVNKELGNA